MINKILITFYERDIRKLIKVVESFTDEDNLWETYGSVKNSCGNLVLHIIGGLNYHIGANIGKTGYIRYRDREFDTEWEFDTKDNGILIPHHRQYLTVRL